MLLKQSIPADTPQLISQGSSKLASVPSGGGGGGGAAPAAAASGGAAPAEEKAEEKKEEAKEESDDDMVGPGFPSQRWKRRSADGAFRALVFSTKLRLLRYDEEEMETGVCGWRSGPGSALGMHCVHPIASHLVLCSLDATECS